MSTLDEVERAVVLRLANHRGLQWVTSRLHASMQCLTPITHQAALRSLTSHHGIFCVLSPQELLPPFVKATPTPPTVHQRPRTLTSPNKLHLQATRLHHQTLESRRRRPRMAKQHLPLQQSHHAHHAHRRRHRQQAPPSLHHHDQVHRLASAKFFVRHQKCHRREAESSG